MADFDLGKVGTDTQLQHLNDQVVIVSVHLTNDTKEFRQQTQALRDLIAQFPNKSVIVTGDFNAQLILDNRKICFYSKDIEPFSKVRQVHEQIESDPTLKKLEQGCITFNDRRIALGTPPTPTTNKVRIITTQLAKILKAVAATIDWCFVVAPENSDLPISVNSVARVGEDPAKPDGLMPSYWCSDHFMVESEVTIGSETYRVGSLNILGESISGGKAYNHFEFIDDRSYQYLRHHHLDDRIKEILNQFLDDFAAELKDPNHPERDQLDQIISKFFVKKNEDGSVTPVDITRQTIKSQKVFGLRDAKFMNIHIPDFIDEDTKQAYQNELDKYLAKQKSDQAMTLYIANKLHAFYNALYNDPQLRPLFESWYNSSKTKKEFSVILQHYLSRKQNPFDVFALQEVAVGGMVETLLKTSFHNYQIYITENFNNKPTTGALIIKRRRPQRLLPTSESHKSYNVIIVPLIGLVIVGLITIVGNVTETFKTRIVDRFVDRKWFIPSQWFG
jgi:hypothetical protein